MKKNNVKDKLEFGHMQLSYNTIVISAVVSRFIFSGFSVTCN